MYKMWLQTNSANTVLNTMNDEYFYDAVEWLRTHRPALTGGRLRAIAMMLAEYRWWLEHQKCDTL